MMYEREVGGSLEDTACKPDREPSIQHESHDQPNHSTLSGRAGPARRSNWLTVKREKDSQSHGEGVA